MKYLNGKYYVEVKDDRYQIHPNENIILRLRDEPNFLRIQYQVQNNTQIRKNQKIIRNDFDEIEVKNFTKIKQPIIQHPKFNSPNCPSHKRKDWLQFDKG